MKTGLRAVFGLLCGLMILSCMFGCGGGGGGSSAVLVSIEVTPTNPAIASGTSQQLTATGIYSDNSHRDLTSLVLWSSSAASVATVSNATGSNGLVTTVAPGTTTVSALMGSITGSTVLTVTNAALVSIGVTPAAPTIALGTKQQFTAMGLFTDNTVQDLTTQVTWSSAAAAVAAVSNSAGSRGLVTTVATGATTVTATMGSVTGGTVLTVTTAALVSIDVTPALPSIALGRSQQLTAMGLFTDNTVQDLTTQVTWSSTAPSVAAVSNASGSSGLVTTVTPGSTAVTATMGSITGGTVLTVTNAALVSIGVSPAVPSIALGRSQQFTATGVFTDNTVQDLTTQVTWSSTAPSVAAVSNSAGSNGLATSVATGSTTVKATMGSIAGSTVLTVTNATLVSIGVTPAVPTIALGRSQQFTAMGLFSDNTLQDLTTQVTWSSSAPSVATVSNSSGSKGLATTVAPGATTVTATLGSMTGSTVLTVTNAALVSIGVTPAVPSIALGRSQQFTATGVFTDNTVQDLTTQVTWSSSSASVATVGLKTGLAVSRSTGTTTVTASLAGKSGSATLTVTSATLESIDVTPSSTEINAGTTEQFTATGTYSDSTTVDLTTIVSWSSSDNSVATVSSTGLVTSANAGVVTITAALGPVSGSAPLTVHLAKLVSIDVSPATANVPIGVPQQFYATGNFDDGSNQDLTAQVTWKTDNTAVATISNANGSNGMASTTAAGQANITASYLGVVSPPATLTVTAATLSSITISPATPRIALGTSLQFAATGTFTDGSVQDISALVAWTSSAGSVASISNATGTRGLATSIAAGTTTITAALGTATATTTLTVSSSTLQSITVAPAAATIFLGATQQYTATGNFSDASSQDLTTQVTWRSSNKINATISNSVGSKGLATPLRAGGTTISATFAYAGVTTSSQTGLTISSAALTGITITPANPTLAVGKTLQLKATGNYAGGLTQDLTNSVNLAWSSSDSKIATVINVPKKNKGLAQGVSAGGPVTITAKLTKSIGKGVSGTTTVTVN